MLLVVLVTNVAIGLLCLIAAWRLWRLKRRLTRAANALIAAERAVHRVLDRAPDFIYRGHAGIHQLRQTYQGLEPQLLRAQQALALLSLGQALWRGQLIGFTRRSQTARRAAPQR